MSNSEKSSESSKKENYRRLSFGLITVLGALIIYFLYQKFSFEEPVEIQDCGTFECLSSVIEIQEFVDPAADPCLDFHQFSCGNFFRNAYKKRLSSPLLQAQIEIDNELDSMIIQPISEADSEPVKIQKTFFRACLNTQEMDTNSDLRVLRLIQMIGGFPLLEGSHWKENDFNWIKVMLQCKQLGLPFQWFLQFGLDLDEDVHILKITSPARDELPIQTKRNILASFMRKKVNFNEIFDFERKLDALLSKQNGYMNVNTVEELQSLYPVFDWIKFLKNLTELNYEISAETEITSNVRDYIVKLFQLLEGTPKRTQANYIIWKIIEFFAPYMSHRHRQHFNSTRLQLCKTKTKENFRYVSEIEYIQKYSNQNSRNSAEELKDFIVAEFLTRLEQPTWLNSTAAELYFGYFKNPEINMGLNLDDPKFAENNYIHLGELKLPENPNIIQLLTQRSKHFYNSLFRQINQTGVQDEEKKIVEEINTISVIYSSQLNKIVIPPSNLHGFLYNLERPQFLNFASLGTQIAQALIKNLEQHIDYFKNETHSIFGASNKCFEDDVTEQMESKSREVIKESFTDIVARDIAYKAYQTWTSNLGEEAELPLLGYSPNQLFWIKSSFVNCVQNPEDPEDFTAIVAKYRNNLSARHSRFFSNDFNCPEKSAMNPPEKC